MQMYSLAEIAQATQGKVIGDASTQVEHLIYDSRKVSQVGKSIFVALQTSKANGHQYIHDLYKAGIAAVIAEKEYSFEGLNQVVVKNSLTALQDLASYHRSKFNLRIIGITGSNGKTIVKEWLSQILSSAFNVVKNPKSFNSQIGVPLSLWAIRKNHEIGIFEAGISAPNEMANLAAMIKPEIGVLTHFGEAHGSNFESEEQKLDEKFKLFNHCSIVISNYDDALVCEKLNTLKAKVLKWGSSKDCDYIIKSIQRKASSCTVDIEHEGLSYSMVLPFTDQASIDNAITSVITASVFIPFDDAIAKASKLEGVDIRLQQVSGINGNTLILDYYNSDLASLQIALEYLHQQFPDQKKVLIMSDMLQLDRDFSSVIRKVNELILEHDVSSLIGIGQMLQKHQSEINIESANYYDDTDHFLNSYPFYELKEKIILLKGARSFEFEKIAERLKKKAHQTVLEVNTSRLVSNLDVHRSLLPKKVKVMAMVKAFAYGAGGYQVAKVLEHHKVDYFGVAYLDEAINLRESGIQTSILIMNPDLSKASLMSEYGVEPTVFSLEGLDTLIKHLQGEVIQIHLEFDTGMHRLGFAASQINEIVFRLKENKNIQVASVYSHLAVADESKKDSFSKTQINEFNQIAKELEKELGYPLIKHLANTAGAQRFPNACFDMVRLGIGLYGIAMDHNLKDQLLPVSTFKSYIAQIKTVKAGDGIGYGQYDKSESDRQIAVIAVGYADGLNRKFSRGTGYLIIKGKKAKIVGNVCMDMCMCDVSEIDCNEGEEAIIFGDSPRIEELAAKLETIPYEILTSVSERVSRIFYQE